LDERGFAAALRAREYREAHRRALRHASERAGVDGVPMFVIGGRTLSGLQDRQTLESAIGEEMEILGRREPAPRPAGGATP